MDKAAENQERYSCPSRSRVCILLFAISFFVLQPGNWSDRVTLGACFQTGVNLYLMAIISFPCFTFHEDIRCETWAEMASRTR